MITPTVAETRASDRARAVRHRVMRSEWPAGKGDAIRDALHCLTAALETYTAVLNEDIHPASAYPDQDLEHDDDALNKALAIALEDAAGWAAELDRLVPPGTLEVGTAA